MDLKLLQAIYEKDALIFGNTRLFNAQHAEVLIQASLAHELVFLGFDVFTLTPEGAIMPNMAYGIDLEDHEGEDFIHFALNLLQSYRNSSFYFELYFEPEIVTLFCDNNS